MSATLSTMLELGTVAPDFRLLDTVSGNVLSLDDVKSGTATVIMFICNHCPYVLHVRDELVRVANDYIPQGIAFVAISANDVTNYPEDSPEHMRDVAVQHGYPFPYLYDESQQTARDYAAACTPDFYIFDGDHRCVYRGQLDDSRPRNNIPVSGQDIRNALDSILAGQPVDPAQTPSIGCNIKWREIVRRA